MAISGSSTPEGAPYCRAFNRWLAEQGFDRISKSDRAALLEIVEGERRAAVETWRATLTESDRLALNHPRAVLRKFKATTRARKPDEASESEPKPTTVKVDERDEEVARELDEALNKFTLARNYIRRLRSALRDANLPVPEAPDGLEDLG